MEYKHYYKDKASGQIVTMSSSSPDTVYKAITQFHLESLHAPGEYVHTKVLKDDHTWEQIDINQLMLETPVKIGGQSVH